MALSVLSKLHKMHIVKLLSIPINIPKYDISVQRMHRKQMYKTQEAKNIRFYVLKRYFEYLEKYERVLEARYPKAMSVYRVFMEGIKEFYADVKEYIKISRFLSKKGNNLSHLTLQQLELYRQMPKDMLKVAPVLLISVLPLANYIIFPLAYYFPRQMLSSHFWNLQQKSEFHIIYLKSRLVHNKPVFRHLQGQLECLRETQYYEPWCNILGKLGSGAQPTCDEILCCKDLFKGEPYHINFLNRNHIKHLLKMHGMYVGIFRKGRLSDCAHMLQAMDRAIQTEGGLPTLSSDVLKRACILRGLNPTNMNNEELILWLQKWLVISDAVNKSNLSLLLHSPILLGYNEPTNWTLIYFPKR